jgi:DNA helicase-2/ATP-dependent DNA helicase PcrA
MAHAERPVFSVSSLAIYETCPWQYYLAFVRQIAPPRSAARDRGTSIHKLIADHLRQPQLLSPDLPGDLAALFDHFKRSRFNAAPVLCESPFRLHFDLGDVRGRIDTVFPRPDGGMEVVDFKSGSAPSRDLLERAIQLPLYTLAVSRRFDLPPADLAWTYFYLRDPQEVTFSAGDGTFAALSARVDRLMRAIADRQFSSPPGCACWACTRWPARVGAKP